MLRLPFFLVLAAVLIHIQALRSGVCFQIRTSSVLQVPHARRRHALGVAFMYSKEDIKAMRASEIKTKLVKINVSTRGIFEKSELEALLFSNQRKATTTLEIPLHDVPFFDAATTNSEPAGKTFLGIDLTIKQKQYRFVVDTGASMNLIKKPVALETGVDRIIQDANTIGMGGSESIAASVCRVDECFLPDIPKAVRNVPFAILDNGDVLPRSSHGLLGLGFLAMLDGLVTFDFERKRLRYGHSSLQLHENSQNNNVVCAVQLRRIFTGLIVTEVVFNGASSHVTGLVDLGSTYTILNTRAVNLITGGRITSLSQLPASPQQVAGIDGRPVRLHELTIDQVKIGDYYIQQPLKVYAADIAGLQAVGLSHANPCCLLGLDVLASGGSGLQRSGRLSFDLRRDLMYLERG